MRRKQATDIVAWQRRFRVLIEEDEAVAVEANETDFGAQPDESVAGLRDGLDGVLRQAVLHDPRLAAVAGERGGGFQRGKGKYRE